MGELTDEDREALLSALPPGERPRHVPTGPLCAAVERIVAAHVEARLAHVEALADEWGKHPENRWITAQLRAALNPTTDDGGETDTAERSGA